MNYFDILLAKKMGGTSPLPENAYLLTTVTDGDLTSAKSKPLPSVSVAVTDADELDVFVGDSESVVSDNEPYLYRQSKGGRMVSERLMGASVAWNQLVRNGNFTDTSEWALVNLSLTVNSNVAKLTSTSSAAQNIQQSYVGDFVNGHVYTISLSIKANSSGHRFGASLNLSSLNTNTLINATNTNIPTEWANFIGTVKFITAAGGYNNGLRIAIPSQTPFAVDDFFELKNVVLFDLTLMFGSTIADYVYSLEQSTAGSGIAWLKSYGFFSEDYYANDSGSLKSVSVSEKSVVGFNQWDEEWELGGIDSSTGQNTVSSGGLRTKGFVPLVPSKTYYNRVAGWGSETNFKARFYDEKKNYIGYKDANNAVIGANATFLPPDNARFLRFQFSSEYGTTYNNDICINISDPSKNGTYEPYKHTTYPLPSSDLRGLYKLSSNKLYCDGDIQYGDGWRLRRYGIVDLGTLEWNYSSTYSALWAGCELIKNNGAIICAKYVQTDQAALSSWGNKPDKCIGVIGGVTPLRIGVKDSAYTDAATFKAAMSGVYLIYELATPTWEKTNPFTNPQTVGSTEEFVANLPVGHESKYYDGDIHHSYIYNGDARAKVTGDVDIVNGTAPNATCSVCVVMPNGDEIWSDAGDVTAEIWT